MEEERNDGKIIDRDVEKEMKTAYIDYAMSVVVLASLIMSASITPSRWFPVLIRRNSINWLTSFVRRRVPRRTV